MEFYAVLIEGDRELKLNSRKIHTQNLQKGACYWVATNLRYITGEARWLKKEKYEIKPQ